MLVRARVFASTHMCTCAHRLPDACIHLCLRLLAIVSLMYALDMCVAVSV